MTCLKERAKPLPAALAVATLALWSIPAHSETMRIRNIHVSESNGDTAVVIAASARPTFTTWQLEQPSRVVVELSGTRLGRVELPRDAGTYAVGLISASVTDDDSAGPRTRIVLTLRQASDYRVEAHGDDITLRVIPHTRPPTLSSASVAQAKADAHAQADAEARVQAEAAAKKQAQAQLQAEARARAEAEAKAEVEAKGKVAAQAQVRAEAEARAQAQARAEVQTRVAVKAQAEAKEQAEARRKTLAELQSESRERLAAQALAEERAHAAAKAKLETEQLRKELADAQRETQEARAQALAAAKENQRQKRALRAAETKVEQARNDAARARQRAETAMSEATAARQREAAQNRTLHVAAQEVQKRQKSLDHMARLQEEQRGRLAAAERLVAEREAAVHAAESSVAERERASRAARARRDGLARDASLKMKPQAEAALAEAERQRKQALRSAERSRQDLAQAVASREQEEARKRTQASERQAEEKRLAQAVALRKAEESRLAEARTEHARLEQERGKLEAERAQLERSRDALQGQVARLRNTLVAAQAARPVASANTPRQPTKRTAPASGLASAAPARARPQPSTTLGRSAPIEDPAQPLANALPRPRSITLRPLSRIHSIDFVDEPSHASVIIDVDDGATFTVERTSGHRLSLRIDHSVLPERLARNLDATEYLGPVKIISSYRDPSRRGAVRVDVDLAEDVPNHVRVDGNRIFWDFMKEPAKAPSLPALLFIPARRVAGFVATVADATWLGQAAAPMPPYLVPPGQARRTPNPEPVSTLSSSSGPSAAGSSGVVGQGKRPGGRFGMLGRKRYTGRRIDLDFKNADIHNILRLLADVGQVNVVVGDDVKGEVTIKMRDVPWDQALDVVLRSKGLGAVREGNLLRVAPLPVLQKELEAEIARQKQIADVLPTETRLIGVSYADAGQLVDKARDLLTPRGKISVDHRTNTLVVSDVPKSLQLIEDLVRNLDTQTAQVTIEARIVEANSDFTRQIGVQWGGTGFADTAHGNPTGLVFPYNVGIGGGADDTASPTSGLVPGPRTGTGTTGNPNFLVNMPAPAGLGTGSAIGLTLGSVAGAFNLNLRLSAMESTGQVRILSSPRITTMDNVEAHIEQGVSIPVSVVSAMGAQTQFVDANLLLSVKPHVTNEGTIAMTINITRNEPDFVNTGARGDPSIQKKEAKTTMLVRDGDTAVIGGIYSRNTGVSNARVPFFSDIPVLGWFFRNKKENDNRSEFLVFITPRIVNRGRSLGQ